MSPDGRRLAAAKPAMGYQRRELCVYAVATRAEQACADLAVLEAGLRIEDVVWSPDSSRLAFAEQTFVVLRDGDLWVMDVATGTLTNVDDDGFGGERLPSFGGEASEATISLPVNPAFSPDGRSLAFSRTIIRAGAWAGNDVAIVDLDGAAPERLVRVSDQTPGVVFGIRWAPDGRRLYYSVHDPQVEHPDNGIWVVGADGGSARHLLGTTDPEHGPPSVVQVSPRGDKLLALYPLAATDFGFRGSAYTLVNVATGAAEPLTVQDPAAPEFAWVALATISPDGSELLTVTRLTDPDFQVFVRDLDAGEEVLLVDGLPGAAPVA
jgi:Tol biopolymer transport system component